MVETDSALSTTANIISILTLVYAVALTVQIHVKALYQAERDTEALARRIGHGEHGINELRAILERLWMHEQNMRSGKAPQISALAENMEVVHNKWLKCGEEWEVFKKELEKGHWGVFGSAKYAPIETPLLVIAGWPALIERRAIPWIAVRTLVTALIWLVAVALAIPLGAAWLTIALLYDAIVFVYNALVWLDLRHMVLRLKWTAKQRSIAERMQEVESTIADQRIEILFQ